MPHAPVAPDGRPRGEAGFTLVELTMATLGLMLISALMVTWFVGVTRAEQAQGDADTAVRQALEVRERITRDLRRARAVTVNSAHEVGIWLDDDGDGVADPGEAVAWRIRSDGALVRSAGQTERIEAIGLDPERSGFAFDAADAALVGRIEVGLTIVAGESVRTVEATVFLRNSGEG